MRLSLRKKLVLAISIIVTLFGMVATVVIFYYSKNTIIDLQKDSLVKISIEQSHETRQLFDSTKSLVFTLSTQDRVISYLENTENQEEDHILEHLNLYNIVDSFSAIYIMDASGFTLASTDESFVGNNYSFRDYFKDAMDDRVAVDILLGVTSNKLGYYFAAPVKNIQGKILGVVVVKMKPEIMHNTLNLNSFANQSHIMMVDQYGVVVYSDKEEIIYKSLGTLSNEVLKEIEIKKRFSNISIEALDYNVLQDKVNNFTVGASVFEIYDEKDGEKEMLSMVKIEDLPFFIVIEEDMDTYITLAANIARILSLIIILAVILAVFGVLLFISKTLAPLNKLKEASENIARGDLKIRVNIQTGDELEDLGNSFNKMAIKLQRNISDIEKKISERTASLEKINKFMTGRELRMMELKKKIINLESKQTKK